MCFYSKPGVRVVFLSLLLLTLASCQPPLKDSSQATLLQTPTLHLLVSPAQIPVETPLTMVLESATDLINVSGELRGVSMYMGRIPLQWRQAEVTAERETAMWTAEFFLGACSDPDMQWQLELWLDYADGRRELQSVQFSSSWR
ncbi:hypothetical protein [Alishewanella longhuensis]